MRGDVHVLPKTVLCEHVGDVVVYEAGMIVAWRMGAAWRIEVADDDKGRVEQSELVEESAELVDERR